MKGSPKPIKHKPTGGVASSSLKNQSTILKNAPKGGSTSTASNKTKSYKNAGKGHMKAGY